VLIGRPAVESEITALLLAQLGAPRLSR
jgi:hypothetical protein